MLLNIKDIAKSFEQKRIFENISFSLNKGEILGLWGVNGCGKSTILNIIADLINQDEGSVERNFSINSIGYISQELYSALLPWQSASGNLKSYNKNGTILLSDFGFTHKEENAIPKYLSGGFRQRLVWACVLSKKNDLLLLDEPFSKQDTKWANSLIEKLLDLKKQNISAIIISHRIDRLILCSDKILIMKKDYNNPSTQAEVINIDLESRSKFDYNCKNMKYYMDKLIEY